MDNEKSVIMIPPSVAFTDMMEQRTLCSDEMRDLFPFIPTGFRELDALMGGFLPGELVVIGGRPGMGKTRFCINLTINLLNQYPVLYLTLGLTVNLLEMNILSAITETGIQQLLRAGLNPEGKEKAKEWLQQHREGRLRIAGEGNLPVNVVTPYLMEEIDRHRTRVVVVDYLQLISDIRYSENREQEIGHIIRELKSVAVEKKICMVVVSQLSRAPEKRCGTARPIMSDLRDSGAVEQEADKVLLLWRPEYYSIDLDSEGNDLCCLMEVIVAKNNTGLPGSIWLKRDKAFTRFTNITREQFTKWEF